MVTNDKEYMRNYYHKNREKYLCKYSGTVYCPDCDTMVVKSYLTRHNRTKKHILNSTRKEEEHSMQQQNATKVYDQVQELRNDIRLKLNQVHRLESLFSSVCPPASSESKDMPSLTK